MSGAVRYLWDFYGPAARGTAEHFAHHTAEFLAARGLTGETGVVEDEPGHAAAWCRVPDEAAAAAVRAALRPKRAEAG